MPVPRTVKLYPVIVDLKSLGESKEATALVVLVATFLVLCGYYMPFLSDDAMISFRYAQRFAAGEGLTWTSGEPVEGYSDFLWVLLHAPFALIGLDLVPVARVIGFCGALFGVISVSLNPITLRLDLGRVLGGAGYLALLVPFAVWAIGGLEHGFMSGILVGSLALAERHYQIHVEGAAVGAASRWTSLPALSILLTALTLLRVDGILIAGLVCLGLSVAALPRLSGLLLGLKVSIGPLVALALQQCFRMVYYHDWIPNTARAKVTVEDVRWEQGLNHVLQGVSATSIGITLALVALFFGGQHALRRSAPAMCVVVGWLGYQIYVGGDIFPSFRQVLLGLVPFAHIAAVGASTWAPPKFGDRHVLSGGLLVALHLWMQMAHPENQRGKTERWEWGGSSIGPLLKQAFAGQNPLLAVDAAGALPYWSGLDALDLLGLNDRYLAQHRPSNFGKGGIGHELGDAEYYLKRKPDIFAFCGAVGNEMPCFAHSKQMVKTSEFTTNYRTVRLEGTAPRRSAGAIQVRIDGSVGIETDHNQLTIPAYFLASPESSVRATLQSSGKLGVTLGRGDVGIIERLNIPPGRWDISIDQTDQLQVGIECSGRPAVRRAPGTVFENQRGTLVDILVALNNEATEQHVEVLKLTRSSKPVSFSCVRGGALSNADLGAPLDGAHWRAPPAVQVPAKGTLDIRAAIPVRAKTMLVSADANDVLLVRIVQNELESNWFTVPRVSGSGMKTRRVVLPSDSPRGTGTMVQFRQSEGDGHASIRALSFQ